MMKTLSQNSKKCLKTSALLFFVLATHALASPITAKILKYEIQQFKSPSFEKLLEQWTIKYGDSAFEPLLTIATDRKNPDSSRYIALMGAAKLGGKNALLRFAPFLKDSSWMIRSAALRTFKTFGNSESGETLLPLIKDPALVIRFEVIDVLEKLNPKGTTTALLDAVEYPGNYRAGKPVIVPQKALEAIQTIKAKAALVRLENIKKKTSNLEIKLLLEKTIKSLIQT